MGIEPEGHETKRNGQAHDESADASLKLPDSRAKFSLGRVVITRTAAEVLPNRDVQAALRRHVNGDWGELDEHDRVENELSLKEGFRLFSVYRSDTGDRFYIITEADRSVTTILLPSDY